MGGEGIDEIGVDEESGKTIVNLHKARPCGI